jgi:GT2 family glycosyltransferase
MQKQFGFVVLNYKNYEETIACVDSILAIEGSNYFIVVVDNESPNESFAVLSDRYRERAGIKVIASGKNGGYSYGNNCGIKHLATLGIHDVIIATSDTLVVSKDILQQLERMDAPDLGVVGPHIQNLEGDLQNPMLAKINFSYVLNIHFPWLAKVLRNVLYSLSGKLQRAVKQHNDHQRGSSPEAEVFMVHGSFLYLSSHYLQRCGQLDETLFMYGEEDLLAYNCYRSGLRMVYQPAIEVIHKDARSTPSENNNSFTVNNSKKSMKYLRKTIGLASLLGQLAKNGKLL